MRIVTSTSAAARLAAARAFLSTRPPATELVIVAASQSISIQLAWNWVRWQPHSALTVWYREQFGKGKRSRRIGIVAVARKLVIALWRYVTTGVVPAGAILKGARPVA